MSGPPFVAALAAQQVLEQRHREAANALKQLPGVGSGPLGLTPDYVKQSTEYKALRATRDEAFSELRKFNSWFLSKYDAEIRASRRNANPKRQAR